MTAGWICALLAGTAAALLVASPARGTAAAFSPPSAQRDDPPARRGRLILGRRALMAGAAFMIFGGFGIPGVVGLLAAAGAGLIWVRGNRRSRARATADQLIEACGVLSSELLAGRPTSDALREAAVAWPRLLPIVRVEAMGGDVPTELHKLAALPGASEARLLAAAWQISGATGEGLGRALERIGSGQRMARSTRRVVESELASARATARLLALLPVAALVLGAGGGSDPLGFLLGGVIGQGCLAAGVGLGLLGVAWIEAIADDVERSC